MTQMAFSAHVMGGSSYCFCSGVICGAMLPVLCMGGSHLCRHRIAHPAAQGQQGDHEGEKQVAHE